MSPRSDRHDHHTIYHNIAPFKAPPVSSTTNQFPLILEETPRMGNIVFPQVKLDLNFRQQESTLSPILESREKSPQADYMRDFSGVFFWHHHHSHYMWWVGTFYERKQTWGIVPTLIGMDGNRAKPSPRLDGGQRTITNDNAGKRKLYRKRIIKRCSGSLASEWHLNVLT